MLRACNTDLKASCRLEGPASSIRTPLLNANRCFRRSHIASTAAVFATRGQPRSVRLLCAAVSLPDAMLSGIKKGLEKALSKDGAKTSHTAATFVDSAPSWEELAKEVAAQRQKLGVQPPDMETGPANPLSLKRTFGQPGEPRIKLYRDHAAWCPYCQKVWLQLEEKQLPYTIEKINMRCYGPKPPEYVAKVRSGLLPAMEIDGQLIIESADIMAALEDEFPEKPMLPAQGTPQRQRADNLMRLERRLFSDWLQWLCSAWNHEGGKKNFIATMDRVDEEMGREGGPYFLGADISMVDLVFAPFLERIVASIPYYKGLVVRGEGRWKNLERWFDSMEKRPAYLGTRSDHYTHVHDLPPQLGGCYSSAGSEELAGAIDGTDGRSWHLPLPPLSATSSPEAYSPGERPEEDRLRAAARLVDNHSAVVRFAARGCGQEGNKPVTAPLSDPSAKPGEEHIPAVDAGLRLVAQALLKGTDANSVQVGGMMSQGHDGGPVVASAEYLRDRVGVPRDLPFPAARQLRAHLNWLIDSLQHQ